MTTLNTVLHAMKALDANAKAERLAALKAEIADLQAEAAKLSRSPPPDKWITVEVTLEIEVPAWITIDENGPDVVQGEPADWRIGHPVPKAVRQFVENEVERIVAEDWQEFCENAAEDPGDRGEYERNARIDRDMLREGE